MAAFDGAGFVLQVFMWRQDFTSKYTTWTTFRCHFYKRHLFLCLKKMQWGFIYTLKQVLMCVNMWVFTCVCVALIYECGFFSQQKLLESTCTSVINYGGHQGFDWLSPLECICIWNSKVRANIFLSARVPEGAERLACRISPVKHLKQTAESRWVSWGRSCPSTTSEGGVRCKSSTAKFDAISAFVIQNDLYKKPAETSERLVTISYLLDIYCKSR